MAGTVNRVILVGRLGKDPEIRYTPSGMAMVNFSLATDESRKDAEGNRQSITEWHNIVLWGKQAEVAAEYLKKGKLIYLEGRIQTRSWEDKQGGGTRSKTEIVASHFTMLGGRSDGDSSESSAPSHSTARPSAPASSDLSDIGADDQDLPF